MAKKQPQYPTLPRYVCRQPNGGFLNVKTGKFLSKAQLKEYEAKPNQKSKPVEQPKVVVQTWHSKYDNY